MRSILREPTHGKRSLQGEREPMQWVVMDTRVNPSYQVRKSRYLRGAELIAQQLDNVLYYYWYQVNWPQGGQEKTPWGAMPTAT